MKNKTMKEKYNIKSYTESKELYGKMLEKSKEAKRHLNSVCVCVYIPGVFLNTVDGGRADGSVVDADAMPGEGALRGSVWAGAVRVRIGHRCVVAASLVGHVAALAGAPLQVPHTLEENMKM